jgi:phenylpropionate dioxygenase-like ring-hydroxylating dioxygenase large terminal subunit
MSFLQNAWYVAAWEDEVEPGTLFHRTILNEPVLLYRTSGGEVIALADRCPHRFLPLHHGKLSNDVVQCAYHGLSFGPTGQCVKSPHGDGRIPRGAAVRRYPTVLRHRAVWIWPGQPDRANPAQIPDYSFMTTAHPNAVFTGYLPTACNFQLATDNIMDLTHADYLHIGTLDTRGAASRTRPQVRQENSSVVCNWWLPGSHVMGVFAPLLNLADENEPVDQWLEVRWEPAALMLLRAGVTRAGRPREEGLDSLAVHLMTPETESTTHYFFGSARNFRPEDAALNEQIRAGVTAAFTYQDKPVLEAQQRSIGGQNLLRLKPVVLPGDAGALRVRRALDDLLAAESQTQKDAVSETG